MSLLTHPSHPGEVLAELYLEPLGMKAPTLAKQLRVPRTRIERSEFHHLGGRRNKRLVNRGDAAARRLSHQAAVCLRLEVVYVDPNHDRKVLVEQPCLAMGREAQVRIPAGLPRGNANDGRGMFVN